MKSTTKEFIKKAEMVHECKYDYSKVEYINNHTKVCIICPEHGEFWQLPSNHLNGSGCPKCAHRSYKKNTEEFIVEAKKIHGDKYDYSKVNYINNETKVCIICPEHGEFWQTPIHHLRGSGCKKCYSDRRGDSLRRSNEEFIKKVKDIFSDQYDYSKVKYVNHHTKICLICPKHGEFWISPVHLFGRKNGCPKCSREKASLQNFLTTENFIKKAKAIHGDYYDYSKVDYHGTKNDVKIVCPKHGEFLQKPNYHLSGNGCPKCNISKLELDMLTELTRAGIEYEFHLHPKFLYGMELDFFIPQCNVAIECQGRQHYKAINFFGGIEGLEKTQKRDTLKKTLCEKNGIRILFYTKEDVTAEDTYKNKTEIIDKIKNAIK